MDALRRMGSETTFMAECFWPGVTVEKVAHAGDRVRHLAHAGSLTSYLGSIVVPGDEIALFMFDAPSIDAAKGLAEWAAIPSERIVEIVRLCAEAR